jgi:hypothetical protein
LVVPDLVLEQEHARERLVHDGSLCHLVAY